MTPSEAETLIEQYDNVSYNRAVTSSSDTRPLEEQIKKLGVVYMESNALLYIISPTASQNFEENVLKKLRNAETITTLRFHEIDFSDDQKEAFDFSGAVSSLLKTYLPKLQIVSVQWMAVKQFQLMDIMTITEVSLTDPQYQDDHFELRLPYLKELSLECCSGPDPRKFAASLIQCPRIELFFSHKYWCDEDRFPTLYLPSCLRFCMRRADCLRKLHLYAPRITTLNLDANYDLSDFKLIQRGKQSMNNFNLKPGEEESKFNLSIVNAVLSRNCKRYLTQHPRVLSIAGNSSEEEQDCAIC